MGRVRNNTICIEIKSRSLIDSNLQCFHVDPAWIFAMPAFPGLFVPGRVPLRRKHHVRVFSRSGVLKRIIVVWIVGRYKERKGEGLNDNMKCEYEGICTVMYRAVEVVRSKMIGVRVDT